MNQTIDVQLAYWEPNIFSMLAEIFPVKPLKQLKRKCGGIEISICDGICTYNCLRMNKCFVQITNTES